ncbi:hypothetical protein F2P79_011423 [Pimephales promelas]|nr:hypothetical protein F2P79_011423 [Pimephales promelas]
MFNLDFTVDALKGGGDHRPKNIKIETTAETKTSTSWLPLRKKKAQLCHVNLLKPYLFRAAGQDVTVGGAEVKSVAFAVGGGSGSLLDGVEKDVLDEYLILPRLCNSEQLKRLEIMLGHLSQDKGKELIHLITEFQVLFSDTPSCTDMIQHDIDVGDFQPIRQRFYRVSPEKLLESEVKYLLENGLAERSSSSWASPCLLVTKPDGTFRFCTDYRKLNSVTKSDSFPLPRVEDCIDSVGSAEFVTKIDLLQGYYQQTQAEGRRDNAKLLLSSAPVLTAPRWNRPFHLKVNCCETGVEN